MLACLCAGKDPKRRFSRHRRLVMLVKAHLGTVKVCKHRYRHRGSLLKLMYSCLSAGKDSKHCFSHRGGLLILVKARLSAVKVSKHRFTQRRSLVKLVQACLGTVNVCKRSLYYCRSR